MTVYGLDISHYQGVPDMSLIAGSGRRFVILKATEGTTYTDPTMATNRRNAHAAGMYVGFYHFAHNGDPIAEADYFLKAVGPLQVNEFLVLDWEVPGNAPAFSKPFLDRVKQRTGHTAGVYLNTFYLTNFDWSAVMNVGYWLWFAKYNGEVNDSPGAWLCSFKQYTSTGSVPGLDQIDLDVFYGSETALKSYTFQPIKEIDVPGTWKSIVSVCLSVDGSKWIVTGIGTDNNLWQTFQNVADGSWGGVSKLATINWGA